MSSKSFYQLNRSLHRDIGFFVIGLTIIYCLSGIVMTFKETSFLKSVGLIEKTLQPNLPANQIGRILHIKKLTIAEQTDTIISFKNGDYDGTYNKQTGATSYTGETYPWVIEKFNGLHRTAENQPLHWFTLSYGVLLLFLALSSFWMYKPGTKLFKRGISLSIGGILASLIMLLYPL